MRGLRKRSRAQTATEYMLTISVVVVSVATAFWLIFADDPAGGPQAGGPAKQAFKNARDIVEAPYP
jgi:hypothetical protein